jgi:hypothetical protein
VSYLTLLPFLHTKWICLFCFSLMPCPANTRCPVLALHCAWTLGWPLNESPPCPDGLHTYPICSRILPCLNILWSRSSKLQSISLTQVAQSGMSHYCPSFPGQLIMCFIQYVVGIWVVLLEKNHIYYLKCLSNVICIQEWTVNVTDKTLSSILAWNLSKSSIY